MTIRDVARGAGYLTGVAQRKAEEAGQKINEVGTNVVNGANQVKDAAIGAVQTTWDGAVRTAQQAHEGITQTVNAAKTEIASAMFYAGEAINGAKAAVVNAGIELGNDARASIDQIGKDLKAAEAKAAADIAAAEAAAQKLVNDAVTSGQQLIADAEAAVRNGVAGAQEKLEAAKAQAGAAIEAARAAGSELLTGAINGAKAELANAHKNAAYALGVVVGTALGVADLGGKAARGLANAVGNMTAEMKESFETGIADARAKINQKAGEIRSDIQGAPAAFEEGRQDGYNR